MPARCTCGSLNPDEAAFCNACGRKIDFHAVPTKCPECGTENPAYVAYCGKCGADLDAGYAKHVPKAEIEPPATGDDYLRYGNSRSLLIWGATTSMTQTQYFFRLCASLIVILVIAAMIAAEGMVWLALPMFLIWAAVTYFWWWIGRRGAGA